MIAPLRLSAEAEAEAATAAVDSVAEGAATWAAVDSVAAVRPSAAIWGAVAALPAEALTVVPDLPAAALTTGVLSPVTEVGTTVASSEIAARGITEDGTTEDGTTMPGTIITSITVGSTIASCLSMAGGGEEIHGGGEIMTIPAGSGPAMVEFGFASEEDQWGPARPAPFDFRDWPK
jgi:hypothetical protein